MNKRATIRLGLGVIGMGIGALLWAASAQAQATPQQLCDFARVKAWNRYVSCVEKVVAKNALGVAIDQFAAFAKCRHKYFAKWTAFQTNASLASSTCIGIRFVPNVSTATVIDRLTALEWETKTNDSSVHDKDNVYLWSTTGTAANSTAFTSHLRTINDTCSFPQHCDWRLPTIAELQTILKDFACRGAGGGPTCSCGSVPCIDGGAFGLAQSSDHFSATTYLPYQLHVWVVNFVDGSVYNWGKGQGSYVRAVHGGL